MKQNPLTLVVGLLLLIVVGLLLFVFQLRKSEVAVVTTFGKATRPITEPGPHLRLPWPIQKVYIFDQRVQNFVAEDKLAQGLTMDNYSLLTSVYVGWRITEPMVFFPTFAGSTEPIQDAERKIEQTVANAKLAIVGKHPLSDFLSPSGQNNKFNEIENQILAAVQAEVHDHKYGLEIEFLRFKKLGLPENVTQSVFERMTSERQVLISEKQYAGEADAQRIKSDADRKAAELLSDATAKATQIRAQGEAQTAESLKVFQLNPELAKFRFRLDALEGSLKERSVLILDQHTPPFDLLWGVPTNLPAKP
jgi:modulator of FtsH protease HflC